VAIADCDGMCSKKIWFAQERRLRLDEAGKSRHMTTTPPF
jgi:hypothetical protein